MRNKSIVPSDVSSSREYYGLNNSSDVYKGTSFKCSGAWQLNNNYFNDEYIIDFVTHDGALWVCQRSHLSSTGNMPGPGSRFWEEVLTGVEGKVYVPVVSNGKLIFTLQGEAPEKPIEIATLHGKSAYDIAVDHGYIGTESEWLGSFKGKDGLTPKFKIFGNILKVSYYGDAWVPVEGGGVLKGDKGEKGDTGVGERGPQGPIGPAYLPDPNINNGYITFRNTHNIADTVKVNIERLRGPQGLDGEVPEFRLVKNEISRVTELEYKFDSDLEWTNLGEVGGKSPRLMRVLSTFENPDQQDHTNTNDRIVWGYDGDDETKWIELCRLDELKGDENIAYGCPDDFDGGEPSRDKIWYDPCDDSYGGYTSGDFLYSAYLDAGGNLNKEDFTKFIESIKGPLVEDAVGDLSNYYTKDDINRILANIDPVNYLDWIEL